jgi:hypothetical protein
VLIAVALNTLLFISISYLIGITCGIALSIFFTISYFKSKSKKYGLATLQLEFFYYLVHLWQTRILRYTVLQKG